MPNIETLPVSFGTGSSSGRNGQEGVTAARNSYIEELGEEGKVPFIAYARNGLEQLTTFGSDATAGIRKLFNLDGALLVVCGRLLFATNESGASPTTIGGIPSDGFVTMARNRAAQVAIVCDGLWFTYVGGILTAGSDPDLPPPICVIEFNGYFIFLIADGRYFWTAIDDITIDGLDFASAESNADPNVMAASRGSEALIFGTKTTQFITLSGDAGTFAPVKTINVGCYAAGTVCNIMRLRSGAPVTDTVIWAATDHNGAYSAVMMLDGYQAVPISNDEVNRLILAETDPTLLRSMAWTEDGHAFYCISGTAFSRCWDSRSERWHNRDTYREERWRMGYHSHVGRSVLFGDFDSNTVYRSDRSLLDDDGDPILWETITPVIHAGPHRFNLGYLHIDVLTGVGINDDTQPESVDPMLMLSYSRDGLHFDNERLCPLGREGQRHIRVSEPMFGDFDRGGVSFKLGCSAAVAKGLMAMYAEIQKFDP